jgi:hypothetical protein
MKAAQYIAMTASVDGQLRFAIAGKRLLEVSYKGSARLVEPHDYGVQNGKDRVLVFQRRVISGGPTFKGSRGRPHQSHNVWDVLYARVT